MLFKQIKKYATICNNKRLILISPNIFRFTLHKSFRFVAIRILKVNDFKTLIFSPQSLSLHHKIYRICLKAFYVSFYEIDCNPLIHSY